MKWSDVHKVLDSAMAQLLEAPTAEIPLSGPTQHTLGCLRKYFRNCSELEVVLCIAAIVLQAIDGTNVAVQLHPSVAGHSCFTDFYTVVKEPEVPLAFIEVKNPTIAVSLGGATDAVAQAL